MFQKMPAEDNDFWMDSTKLSTGTGSQHFRNRRTGNALPSQRCPDSQGMISRYIFIGLFAPHYFRI